MKDRDGGGCPAQCHVFSFLRLLLATAFAPAIAHADGPAPDAADGPAACRALAERNESERDRWDAKQPRVPHKYPREDYVLGAPWGRFFDGVSTARGVLVASLLPHVGAELRLGSAKGPATVVAWPWSFPIGPAFSCSRAPRTFVVRNFRAHRLMVEPGIVAGDRGAGVYARPGYRFVLHPTDWVVGFGGGLGSTIELFGNREPSFRPSVSPEALLHFGQCCEPGYFTLTFRVDHFFGGDVHDALGATLGYVYF